MSEPLHEAGQLADAPQASLNVLAYWRLIVTNWRLLLVGPLAAGVLSIGITALMSPVFTAKALIMPPQQSQSAGALALQSLGALAGVAGAAAGIKNPTDQYVALMQSRTVEGRIIDEFKLLDVYDVQLRMDAHKKLRNNSVIQAGKRDGLVSIEVSDHDPQRAAALANAYITQLMRLTNELAITEAQRRRKFFEDQLQQATAGFDKARRALQAAGINEGVLRAEPRAAADGYAKLRAEITAVEVRLRAASVALADSTPEVQRLRAELAALQALASKAEAVNASASRGDYIERYKEFKYQETLVELFSRQYELARVDESRDGAIIQVVDAALPPERKSRPQRALIAVLTTLLTGLACVVFVFARAQFRLAPAAANGGPAA